MSETISNILLVAMGFAIGMAWFNLQHAMLLKREKRLNKVNAAGSAAPVTMTDPNHIVKLQQMGDRFNEVAYRGLPKATMIEMMQQWQKELDVQLSDRVWENVHVQLDQLARRRMDYVRAKIQSRR